MTRLVQAIAIVCSLLGFSLQSLSAPFQSIMDAYSNGGCDPTVSSFRTEGRNAAGDGGGALWVFRETPIGIASINCANGRVYELSAPVANVRIFGAMGQNEGDNAHGFQQAFAYARAKGIPVYAPAGVYQLHSQAALIDQSGVAFYGDGQGTRLRAVNLTTEVFNIAIPNGGTVADLEFRDFAVEAYYDQPVPASAIVFRVTGGVGYAGGQWRNIESRGFPAFMNVSAASHPTPYGMEGALNWSHFENITFGSFSREHLYGWLFDAGSGTGNSYHQIGGKMNNIVWAFGGDVVGDISIEAMKQWSSANTTDSTLLLIHDGTRYRSRIKMHGGQCDAGFARLIAFGSGIGYTNVDIDVMRGGNCAVGPHPALYNSRIGASYGTVPAS